MITTEQAIDFICKTVKDTSDENRAKAAVALSAGVGQVSALGGRGWDFSSDQISFSTIADRESYYVNKGTNDYDNTHCINTQAQPVRLIDSVWYGSSKVHKRTPEAFFHDYQGQTGSGTPYRWTAFGNIFRIAPVPGDAYELVFYVKRRIVSIEQFPEDFQHAPLFAAVRLMQEPKFAEALEAAMKVIRSSDGIMDFTDESGAGYNG